MKYKAYITDSDKIFWTKNSVDKPTKDYFKYLMDTQIWKDLGNITPNFINQFNGSITVDKDTYTYLKLFNTDTRETKYFSIDSVSRVLSNGFVVDITLDVFTTYTLNLYNELEGKPIKVNRTTAYCLLKDSLYSQMLKDDLIPLPFKPALYKFKNELYELPLYSIDDKNNTQYVYDAFNDSTWSLNQSGKYVEEKIDPITIKNKNNGYLYENALFDVFQDVNGDWFFVPIFGYCTDIGYPNHSQDKRDWLYVSTTAVVYQGETLFPEAFCWNTLPFTDKIKNNTFWANKYVGRYILPNWVRMFIDFGVHIIVRTNRDISWNGRRYEMYGCILMFKIPNKILSTNNNINQHFDFSKITTNIFDLYNKSNLVNSYVYSKITQMSDDVIFNFNNSFKKVSNRNYPDISNVGLFINNNLPSKNLYLSFYTIKGATWFNTNLPFVNKLSSFEVLPSNTNVYNQYLASVQSQQNTSIAVSAQQMFMGMFRSAYSGASQMLNAVGQLGNNAMFAAGGIVNAVGSTISGMMNSVLQYANTKRQIESKNADVLRASSANNINTTNENSNIANSVVGNKTTLQNKQVSWYEFDGVIANGGFDLLNIRQYNKTVWESGYLINNVVFLSKLKEKYDISFFDDKVNSFIYWDIEIPNDYIKLIYPQYNNELIEAISTTINNPIRFWKESEPNYTADFTIGWVNK